MSTSPLRSAMVPVTRQMRAYFAPVDRANEAPTIFDPGVCGVFPLNLPPAPWVDLGGIDNFTRWACWDMVDRVLACYRKPHVEIPIVRRSILRYALRCPGASTAAFVQAERKKFPEVLENLRAHRRVDLVVAILGRVTPDTLHALGMLRGIGVVVVLTHPAAVTPNTSVVGQNDCIRPFRSVYPWSSASKSRPRVSPPITSSTFSKT